MQNAIQQAITQAFAGNTLNALKWAIAENKGISYEQVGQRFGFDSPVARIKKLVASGGIFTDENGVINKGDITNAVTKAAVAASTVANTPNLVYPGQRPGVVYDTPVTTPILEQITAYGALGIAPFQRLLSQAANLTAAHLANEDSPVPAAAPATAFNTTDMQRFGLILAVTAETLSVSADDSVLSYVVQQLETAVSNALDVYFSGLVTANSAAAATAQAAIAALPDARYGVFVAAPDTLMNLQDAANPNPTVSYKTRPVIQSLAVPAGKLWLVQANRVTVTDPVGNEVSKTNEADIVLDDGTGTANTTVTHLFQNNMAAVKIMRRLSAKLLSPVQVVTLS
ncbi:hypothetical protein PQR53_07820 [Paraburkholderia fungorum]|uniref:hypothetical protein n=1 Tax=Paraburkholderia fungorum TaxID=134537 RepID=UPI0038B8E6F2